MSYELQVYQQFLTSRFFYFLYYYSAIWLIIGKYELNCEIISVHDKVFIKTDYINVSFVFVKILQKQYVCNIFRKSEYPIYGTDKDRDMFLNKDQPDEQMFGGHLKLEAQVREEKRKFPYKAKWLNKFESNKQYQSKSTDFVPTKPHE